MPTAQHYLDGQWYILSALGKIGFLCFIPTLSIVFVPQQFRICEDRSNLRLNEEKKNGMEGRRGDPVVLQS